MSFIVCVDHIGSVAIRNVLINHFITKESYGLRYHHEMIFCFRGMLRHLLNAQESRERSVKRALEEVLSKEDRPKKKVQRMMYTVAKKEAFVHTWKSLGWSYSRLKLYYGSKCPPRTTLLGCEPTLSHMNKNMVFTCYRWKEVYLMGGEHKGPGRPTFLSRVQETELLTFLASVRKTGAIVDQHCLGLLAQEVAKLHGQEPREFSRNWARSFRKRNKLSRVRLGMKQSHLTITIFTLI